jgi:hypothetical protein
MSRVSSPIDALIALREALARLDAANPFLQGSVFTASDELTAARRSTDEARRAIDMLLRREEKNESTTSVSRRRIRRPADAGRP